MADIVTYPWVIIAEAVVIESCLIILILSQLSERDEVTESFYVSKVAVDIIVCLPNNITVIIVCLDGTTDVVADDTVMPVTNNLGCRDIAVAVVNPRDEILNWFRPVKCDLTSLNNISLFFLSIMTLTRHYLFKRTVLIIIYLIS